MAERDYYQTQFISEEERLRHPFTSEVVADVLDRHEEMLKIPGDEREGFFRVSPEQFHLAMLGVLFDERNRIRENGIFLSQRAARFLKEDLNLDIQLVDDEPSSKGLNYAPEYYVTDSSAELPTSEMDSSEEKDSSNRKVIWMSGARSKEQLRKEAIQLD